ncbi:kinase-like protein [Pseudovirgaria hyperparasitica]|uniref:non-specific serine/threonine protein kinase n=1 Tax=Pseudovirgaria hyperparasitica TaxID=470096 RepID=A0A6A6VWW1_9PEZI|nr:kinase-like protein [Pseudovirgaria hyperparasitica]KAF2754655.1 kinase-like protein [Pseudovirgaria hyperparasitica]
MIFHARTLFQLRTPVLHRSRLIVVPFIDRAGRVTSRYMSSTAAPFEEEREEGFAKFYPMTLGEVIHEKYKVVAKLGFGSTSTIWCCRNLATNTYTALKIYAHDLIAEDDIHNETAIYKHLSTAGNPDHPGKKYVRTIQDSFFITSRMGNIHQCLTHEVLSNDILNLRHIHPDRKMPEALLRSILLHLLLALDFLHSECHVIHTDIKEENILLGLVDSSILDQLDTQEIATSSLYQTVNGYNIYRSVRFGIPTTFGRPILCDFSLARHGQVKHCHDIQPDPYRAPEVILEIPWGYAVDIWNVGVMVWDMFENRHMFNGHDPKTGKYENRFHLASIVGLLGPPPLEFLQRSEYSSVYFDDRGNWKCVNPVSPISWDDIQRNPDITNKKGFIDFIRKMLQWKPESRASASELLEDRWLLGM